MKPNIFISYCRREVGFVDDLASRLEKNGYKVWLDYHSLVPGRPWEEQIFEGLEDSDVVLLVVSKESITSENVYKEWDRFLDKKNRLILLIFENVDLTDYSKLSKYKWADLADYSKLESFEWVDFRGSYEKGLKELFSQLEKPVQEDQPPPKKGIKFPAVVWVAFFLSLIVMAFSLSAFWTLFLPWFLIPLPYRILKRNFNFTEVQTALILLPFCLFLGSLAAFDQDISDSLYNMAFESLLFVIPLIFILRSRSMQRWGKPVATRPVFANPYKPNVPNPKTVTFFIDYAVEDRLTAEDMTRVFEKYGHKQATDMASAEVILTLISDYKTDTDADTNKQVVFPVKLQPVDDDAISDTLKQIQWVDFSKGVRNLDAMAQLLPEPNRLLSALGIRPMSRQLVLPPVIMALRYFVLLLGIFSAGAVINYLLDFFDTGYDLAITGGILFGFILCLSLIGVLVFLMIKHVTARRGWFASVPKFIIGLAGLGALIYTQYVIDGIIYDSLDAEGQALGTSPAILYPIYVFLIGGLLMVAFSAIRWRDVRRWFPARARP